MKWPRRSIVSSRRPTSSAGNGSRTMIRRTVGSPVRAAEMVFPASAPRSTSSTWTRSGSSGMATSALVWHSRRRRYKLAVMPLAALIAVVIASIGCVVFLATQVRTLRRRKRNLDHWEKDEPLEGVGDWD